MSKICEHHSKVLIQAPETLQLLIETLVNSLKDRPKISQHACVAIEKLSKSLKPISTNQPKNAITDYFQVLA
jgi:hypothetical protein